MDDQTFGSGSVGGEKAVALLLPSRRLNHPKE